MTGINNVITEKLFIKVNAPIQCHLWTKKELIYDDFHFKNIRKFYGDNHLERRIIKCIDCGQFYYYEFYEVIDWEKGNDKMYCTYIPIEVNENLIKDLNSRLPIGLLAVTPQLHWDPDGRIYWDR